MITPKDLEAIEEIKKRAKELGYGARFDYLTEHAGLLLARFTLCGNPGREQTKDEPADG
jgi:hypothetical protein